MKKALIIAPDFLGYVQKITDNLKKNKTIEVTDICVPQYEYPNFFTRSLNFFLKKISRDVKFNYRGNYVNQIIGNKHYDVVLIIRPDLFSVKIIKELSTRTPLFKTYFYDGAYRYPRKFKMLKFFNEIYSFEPSDCEKFGFIPITNYIYEELPLSDKTTEFKYYVFNITSFDRKRFPILLRIASILKEQNKAYKIIVKTNKEINTNGLIDIIKEPMPLKDIKHLLKDSICMLDLGQIHKHRGLTFRVFEAMGLNKKIITHNPDIANYDFYDPQNILIIDKNNIDIPDSFLHSDYNPIPDYIYNKYTLDTWVKTVFKELF